MPEGVRKLTKRTVDLAQPGPARYILWDSELKGFGLRVETSGTKTYLVRYRTRRIGAEARKRFVTIGRHGVLTAEKAREKASATLLAVVGGADPAGDRSAGKQRPSVRTLFDDFMRLHVEPKLKPKTAEAYRSAFRLYVLPEFGSQAADDLTPKDLLKLHSKLAGRKVTANRILTAVSAMYGWAQAKGFGPKGHNPAFGIERYSETRKERFLSVAELDRLGTGDPGGGDSWHPVGGRRGSAECKAHSEGGQATDTNLPTGSRGASPSALHRRSTARNPAPAMVPCRFRAGGTFPSGFEDRQEDDLPQWSGADRTRCDCRGLDPMCFRANRAQARRGQRRRRSSPVTTSSARGKASGEWPD